MKIFYLKCRSAKFLLVKFFIGILFLSYPNLVTAQTTCTNNATACSLAIPDLSATLSGGLNTLVTANSNTLFTATQTANTSSLIINSGQYRVTSANGCVLVSFTQLNVGVSSTTNVSVVLSNGTVITCSGVVVNAVNGNVCIQICDARITNGSIITLRVTVNSNTGNFNNASVQISALALVNLATNISCPSSFICLPSDCPAVNACGTGVAVGKIRVFFSNPIGIGTPTPSVTAVAIAGVTAGQFQLCIFADAGTNVVRNFVDYCVYSTALVPVSLPTIGLSLTLQSGTCNPLTCLVGLSTIICPTGIAQINDGRPCTPCDAAFPFAVGKVRIFFPALGAGVPGPVITGVINAGAILNQFKLCAIADVGTNVSRTYADYCVFSTLATNVFPFLSTTLSLSVQTNSCNTALPTVCAVVPVTLPPCTTTSIQVSGTINSTGAVSGSLGTCANTTSCNNAAVYIAAKIRVTISPCLPAGVAAPNITSLQKINVDGSLSLLNQNLCFVVSDESAAQVNTTRCFVDYCVYSKVIGDNSFENLGSSVQVNTESTVVAGVGGPLATSTCTIPNATGGPLAISLLSFSSQQKNCAVVLKWSTNTEQQSKEFIVQHSTNGSFWTTIGNLKAQGTTNIRTDYYYTHTTAQSGRNFYRFLSIALDGQSKNSSVLTTKVSCNTSTMDVSPNPFVDHINIVVNAVKSGNGILTLTDNLGRQVYSIKRYLQLGANNIKITDLNNFAKGFYILSVKTEDGAINERLIK